VIPSVNLIAFVVIAYLLFLALYGVLVAIEQGRSNPNLGNLTRIGDAFGVPVTLLVDVGGEPSVRISRPDDSRVLWRGPSGGTGTIIGVQNRFTEFQSQFNAQVSSNRIGAERLLGFMDEYGLDSLAALAHTVQSRAEQAMRDAIRAVPDGTYRSEVWYDGLDEPLRLPCAVAVAERRRRVTSPARVAARATRAGSDWRSRASSTAASAPGAGLARPRFATLLRRHAAALADAHRLDAVVAYGLDADRVAVGVDRVAAARQPPQLGEHEASDRVVHVAVDRQLQSVVVEVGDGDMTAHEPVAVGEFADLAGGGVGLSNVDARLRATFGERYALRMESAPGEGTSVIMTVPNLAGDDAGTPLAAVPTRAVV